LKEPSPAVNPASQCGLAIWGFSNKTLLTGRVLGKAAFKLSDKPQLRDALIDTIFSKPSKVKCCLSCIIVATSLNRI
jgi:hypothetical protein